MIRPICRMCDVKGKEIERYFVTSESGSTEDVNFAEPEYYNRFEPVTTELYVLEYLKISFQRMSRLTFKYVLEQIPQELIKDVVAVEWIKGFYDSFDTSCFVHEYHKDKAVVFVALLTDKNTGKKLPGLKLTEEHRPINISDDEWRLLLKELS